jgi:hypothetical protein
MTEEQIQIVRQQLIYLVGCAVRNEKAEADRIPEPETVLDMASSHMLSAAAAMALKSAGFKSESIEKAVLVSHRNAILYQTAWNEIAAGLDQSGIRYMPLKGVVLKDLYPKVIMREMSDYDILIDPSRAGDVKAMMEELGFITESFQQTHHDLYFKPPILKFEMHTRLFSPTKVNKLYEYYKDVKDRLIPVQGSEYRFSPEDCYLYMIAHEYKHYCSGGTGLRSLLDTYVYLKKVKLDQNYIAAETEKLGISEFEETNRCLALHLFDNESLSQTEREMLEYMLSSCVYGTVDHQIKSYIKKTGGHINGRMGYILTRLFIPMNDLKAYHPFVYKHKILLPFLSVYRIIRVLLFDREQVKKEWLSLNHLSPEKKKKK